MRGEKSTSCPSRFTPGNGPGNPPWKRTRCVPALVWMGVEKRNSLASAGI